MTAVAPKPKKMNGWGTTRFNTVHVCLIEGCPNTDTTIRAWYKIWGGYLCQRHFRSFKRSGGVAEILPRHAVCMAAGCTKKHFARGWCEAHYQRWHRHGEQRHNLLTLAQDGLRLGLTRERIRQLCLLWERQGLTRSQARLALWEGERAKRP